ncbi:hypothetical protein RB595_008632 [Gaeumannomyces hyphopodioides]
MYERIEPNAWVALRLPSDSLKVMQVVPNTTISLGKYGSFPSNLIIHRPYHVTFEVQDKRPGETFNRLRIVPPAELYADVIAEEAAAATAPDGGVGKETGDGVTLLAADEDVEYSVVGPKGEIVARSSRELLDEDARQTLSFEEIEDLKREGAGAGKELITKLMLRHTALDLKTQFSLSKYKLLKTRKYIRRFAVLPYDPTQMGNYLLEDKDAGSKILEMREEMVALVGCWANVHYGGDGADVLPTPPTEGQSEYDDVVLERWRAGDLKEPLPESGRWLVVDDTGGLLVAALAEKMGILYSKSEEGLDASATPETQTNGVSKSENSKTEASASNHNTPLDDAMELDQQESSAAAGSKTNSQKEDQGEAQANGACGSAEKSRLPCRPPARNKRPHDFHIPYSDTNTITIIHPNSQANLSYLRQYGYDSTNPNHPPHPLLPHLLTLTWLQLLSPEADTTYSSAPPVVPADEVAAWKANRRGNYHRKRRRWARTRHVVDTTRGGNFSGLVVATSMDPVSVLRRALPLLAGGAPVAVYSPTLEPLARLADCYSVARRAAWMACGNGDEEDDMGPEGGDNAEAARTAAAAAADGPSGAATPRLGLARREGSDEFPVNPTLLLGVCIQTSRVRKWQVLPNRTHPVMTSRGGAEGYVLTGWRAVPVAGKVEARGKFLKRQKRGD